ncbi:hypothetical protein BH23PLA1_BH23PLA1_42830 [soil metagenome]
MPTQPVVIHERLGNWSRQLRPRLTDWPIRWVESRSTADLISGLQGTVCPILVLDLGRQVRQGIEDLAKAAAISPDALILVLDPLGRSGMPILARECGATLLFQGFVPPPNVAALIERWLPLARRRAEAFGWIGLESPEPTPWEPLEAM